MVTMKIRVATAILATLALTATVLVGGCQPDNPAEQTSLGAAQDGPVVPQSGLGKTLSSGQGYPISNIKEAPQDVQDWVDRSHAIVVGTIASVSSPQNELPYDKAEDDYPAEDVDSMRLRVTYYDIAVEQVLLDDGVVSKFPRLRLDGDHNLMRPQVGERFVFSLARNPDNMSYGVVADWMVLTVANGVRNYDGTAPAYSDVTDEATFLKVIRTAAESYNFKAFSDWPDKL